MCVKPADLIPNGHFTISCDKNWGHRIVCDGEIILIKMHRDSLYVYMYVFFNFMLVWLRWFNPHYCIMLRVEFVRLI